MNILLTFIPIITPINLSFYSSSMNHTNNFTLWIFVSFPKPISKWLNPFSFRVSIWRTPSLWGQLNFCYFIILTFYLNFSDIMTAIFLRAFQQLISFISLKHVNIIWYFALKFFLFYCQINCLLSLFTFWTFPSF